MFVISAIAYLDGVVKIAISGRSIQKELGLDIQPRISGGTSHDVRRRCLQAFRRHAMSPNRRAALYHPAGPGIQQLRVGLRPVSGPRRPPGGPLRAEHDSVLATIWRAVFPALFAMAPAGIPGAPAALFAAGFPPGAGEASIAVRWPREDFSSGLATPRADSS